MKEQIAKLKQELKSLARQIKEKKSQRKNKEITTTGCVPGLLEAKIAYRHKHVAYCLTRGRKLEQCDSGKNLNMTWVNWIINSMSPESKEKLYVIVSDKLSSSQQAVQGGHAVAEFLRKNPNTQWRNGHLIYLKCAPGYRGDLYIGYFAGGVSEHAAFREPDLDNKVTAFAVFSPDGENLLRNFKLV